MKGCLKRILILVALCAIGIIVFFIWLTSEVDEAIEKDKIRDKNVFSEIIIGDSIFVNPEMLKLNLEFYQLINYPLNKEQQANFKYSLEDTIIFSRTKQLTEKYFYKRKTSFLGICKSKLDQPYQYITFEENGPTYSKWIEIGLSEDLKSLPSTDIGRIKDQVKWVDLPIFELIDKGLINNKIYLKTKDITNINSDNNF